MPQPQSNPRQKPSLNRSVFCFAPEPQVELESESSKYCFRVQPLDVAPAADDKKQRTFSGIAYSGEPITDHWYWDRVIFDLASMQIKGRIPALLDHRASQRAGAINEHKIDNSTGLSVSGVLMSNEFGTQIAQDSDDGFPWQMSVRIEPGSIENVQAEQTVTVNGKTYQGPIAVFRGGRIREVSFCALGADDNTNAVAASHKPKSFTQEDTNVTELEQANARIKELEGQVTGLQDQNKQFAADKREAEIAALATELGSEFSAEDAVEMKGLDDKAFAFTAKQLRAAKAKFAAQAPQKPKLPAHLFSEQATTGKESASNTLDDKFNKFSASLDGGK